MKDEILDPDVNPAYGEAANLDMSYWEALEKRDLSSLPPRVIHDSRTKTLKVPFLNKIYEVDMKRREIRGPGLTFTLALVMIIYLLKCPIVLGKRWVTAKELRGGDVFFHRSHPLSIGPIREKFGYNASGLIKRGVELGGKPIPFGDGTVQLEVLPGVSIRITVWEGDDEVEPGVTILFPEGIDNFLPLDVIWGMVNLVVKEIISQQ